MLGGQRAGYGHVGSLVGGQQASASRSAACLHSGHCAGVFLLKKEVWALYLCAFHMAMSHAFSGEKIKLSSCVSAVQAIIVQETTIRSSYCRGLFLHFSKIFAF